jgi:hypothetical protein
MRQLFFSLAAICFFLISKSQNVGIGTSSPLARLHVTDSAVVFSASGFVPGIVGNPPISGEGRRMMWYADKGAFRAGYVESSNWDKDSIGQCSAAFGYNNKALGNFSLASGISNYATGASSIALGQQNVASGAYSTALGSSTITNGAASFTAGGVTIANGPFSTAMGHLAIANGFGTFAAGFATSANGNYSAALGTNTTAKAYGSLSIGNYNNIADNPNPVMWSNDDRIFQIGNGTSSSARSNAFTVLQNGNSGIGTVTPLARLHVIDSNVLFSAVGDVNFNGSTPLNGAGKRMMWFANKAAFRSGYVDGAHWDADSIGFYSVAVGKNNKAKGWASFATGLDNLAAGDFSTTMGRLNNASGTSSVALGQSTIASGPFSIATGASTKAANWYSTASGFLTTANGHTSTAIGNTTIANGANSFAAGLNTTSDGLAATAIGITVTSKSYGGFVAGLFNDISDNPDPTNPQPGDRIFQIGNGFGTGTSRSNAMTVLHAGNIGMGTLTPLVKLHVAEGSILFSSAGDAPVSPGNVPISGEGRRMMWFADKAAFRAGYVIGNNWDQLSVGYYSVALGFNTKAVGTASVAMGSHATANGVYSISFGAASNAGGASSIALGEGTVASADYATAIGSGTIASGRGATSMGIYTTASGQYSTASGYYTTAKAHGSVSIGQFNNNSDNPSTFIPQTGDRIFQLGNGDNDGTRSNAITVLRNGNTGIGMVDPAFRLDVGARMRIRATPGLSAGLWLNNDANTTSPAFVGMRTDTEVGFYGQTGTFGWRFYVNTITGDAWLQGILTQASDSRLKKNISPLQNSLKKILLLNGYHYNWKDENADNKLQTGLLAQEVQKLFPELVAENKEGFLSVNYSGLIPVMLESIKEQQKQIDAQAKNYDALQKENEKLTIKNKEFETRLEKLEKLMANK